VAATRRRQRSDGRAEATPDGVREDRIDRRQRRKVRTRFDSKHPGQINQ